MNTKNVYTNVLFVVFVVCLLHKLFLSTKNVYTNVLFVVCLLQKLFLSTKNVYTNVLFVVCLFVCLLQRSPKDNPVLAGLEGGSRLLFLDGGGIKGLSQIEALIQLEEATGRKITELFDWIVGTSTGGVIALALVYGECVPCTYRL